MAEMAREMRTLAVRNDGAGVEEDATRHFFETRLHLSTHVVLRRLPNVAKICLRLIFPTSSFILSFFVSLEHSLETSRYGSVDLHWVTSRLESS